MNTLAIENNQANILARAIDCHIDGLSPEVGRLMEMLKLKAQKVLRTK